MTSSDRVSPATPSQNDLSAIERSSIREELETYVAKTMALASEGRHYQEVIAHIGAPPPRDQEELNEGEDNGVASVHTESRLFSFISFRLGSGDDARRIVHMEFFAEPGAFTMDDLRSVFGPWHRTPEEDEGTLFVLAWFPRYDKSNGAQMFLYADDAGKDIPIAPGQTPGRIFFTSEYARDEC